MPRLLFPHEKLDDLAYPVIASSDMSSLLAQVWHLVTIRIQLRRLRHGAGPFNHEEIRARAFELFNGSSNGVILQNKYLFGKLLQSLGYLTPRSILVNPGDSLRVLFPSVIALDTVSPQRFCKPQWGSRGSGISISSTPEDALYFAIHQTEPYLIQKMEEPVQDWRYVFHRSPAQLASGTLPGWRIAYKKVRPYVLGDGQSVIRNLVERAQHIPSRAKSIYKKQHKEDLLRIPALGERVSLIGTGNISVGAYGILATAQEQASLDRFMLRFLKDIERELSCTLATCCFDLGTKDSAILTRRYDYDAIKRCVVFYEHQMTFGTSGYIDALTFQALQVGKYQHIPTRLLRNYLVLKVQYRYESSFLQSGVVIRAF